MTQMVYALIFAGLGCALLTALLVPAPGRPADREYDITTTLFGCAAITTLLMGALALTGHHVASVICGAVAWLVIVPCLWLARAAPPAGEWDDEDDDGGSPGPVWPFTPPAPDDGLPGLTPSALTSARASVAPAPAFAPSPALAVEHAAIDALALQHAAAVCELAAAVQAQDVPELVPAPLAADVVETHRSTLRRAPRVRGDDRSVAHVRRSAHHAGRRRRASLRRRLLATCRRLLWVQGPECEPRAGRDVAHEGRRHAAPSQSGHRQLAER